ncbi:MAG: ferrochelatase [Verrucomicrobiota bacterium]|nr:ferrochelatase [Verrucomicrobiota bacterium]
MNNPKKAVLLINLGTPDSPEVPAVRRYLRQFLSDPRVLDSHPLIRALVLNLFILPFRPQKSAVAYRQIWTSRGSPLLFHTSDLTEKVREQMGPNCTVDFAMRYGNPSIPSRLEALCRSGHTEIVIFPLYPQYASSSTGSSLEVVHRFFEDRWNVPAIKVVPPFYSDPGYISAFANNALPLIEKEKPEHFLFSYHGLPERHITKSECEQGFCLKQNDSCCSRISSSNAFCYKAQCYETTRLITTQLGLSEGSFTTSFQSRLGRTPWIKPYTDEMLVGLAKKGVKKLLVLSPAFTADCLETLEELQLRAKEDFIKAGGDWLGLVPSLNSSEAWVDSVVRLANGA